MTQKNILDNGRIIAIDGLRGICALIVVMNHFTVAFFPSAYWGESAPSHTLYNIDTWLAQSPISAFYAGNYAVCIFFVISGFVLSKNFYLDGNKLEKIATNRYLRLCIPIFFSTLITFILMKLNLFYCREVISVSGTLWFKNFYAFTDTFFNMVSITLFDVFFIGNSQYNTVFWMIPILFYGSFLTLLIVKLWGNMRNRQIIYFLLIIIFYKLNNLYYITFVLGILCADIHTNYKNIIYKINNTLSILCMTILAIYLGSYPTGVTATNVFYSWLEIGKNSYQIYHILGALLIFMVAISSESIQKLFSGKILQYLGRISFSIYLIHATILSSLSCYLFLSIFNITQKYQLSFLITFVISIIVIILSSHLFYNIVEKNANKVISKIYNKFFVN